MPEKINILAGITQIMKPGTKEPKMSREAPTIIGERNMPNPATVIDAPHTIAILFGVIQGNSMGNESRIG